MKLSTHLNEEQRLERDRLRLSDFDPRETWMPQADAAIANARIAKAKLAGTQQRCNRCDALLFDLASECYGQCLRCRKDPVIECGPDQYCTTCGAPEPCSRPSCMNALLKLAVLFLLVLTSVQAAEPRAPHGGLRKGLAVAACAASAFDLGTTAAAAHNPNLREANGLFAGPGGRPKVVSLSIAKAAACGVSLYFAWRPVRGAENVPMYGSAATAAILSAVGFHNLQVLERAK